jgi:hypothetical protein
MALRPPPDPTPAALPVNGFPRTLLALTDGQLETIMAAAHPLAPAARSAFLEGVAARLAGVVEIGDGVVSRACRELQRVGSASFAEASHPLCVVVQCAKSAPSNSLIINARCSLRIEADQRVIATER